MSDTTPETPVEEAPKEVKEELKEVEKEAGKLEEKLENPDLSPTDKIKIEKRLDVLDDRMEELLQKVDKLAASPVAPSPRREPETPAPEAPSDTPSEEEKPKVKKKRYGSSLWFGDRAYEDE